jgi:hypothetical protein
MAITRIVILFKAVSLNVSKSGRPVSFLKFRASASAIRNGVTLLTFSALGVAAV